jgi:hypothetical protein
LYRFSLTAPTALAIALIPGSVTIFCYPDQASLSSFLFLHKSNTACILHDISHQSLNRSPPNAPSASKKRIGFATRYPSEKCVRDIQVIAQFDYMHYPNRNPLSFIL